MSELRSEWGKTVRDVAITEAPRIARRTREEMTAQTATQHMITRHRDNNSPGPDDL